VREVKNLLERILILEKGEIILPEHLPPEIIRPHVNAARPQYRLAATGISLEQVEKDFVRQALELARGNQTRAAQLLGISRDALRYRMHKLDSAA
jgi:DNA-binding NtrC family response regulator